MIVGRQHAHRSTLMDAAVRAYRNIADSKVYWT
jgi:hypothetical protein